MPERSDAAPSPQQRAELSSAATSLDDLAARIDRLGTELHDGGQEALATDLFEVERGLRAANRRLTQVLARLG